MILTAPENVTAISIDGIEYAVTNGVIEAPEELAILLIEMGFYAADAADVADATNAADKKPRKAAE